MLLRLLYLFSDIAFVVLFYVVRYRRKVTRANLSTSFPDKSLREIHRLERRYYRHLCDMLAEGIYNLFAKPRDILSRYCVLNREVVNRYFEEGRSVVLMSAHLNNWEFMITTLDLQFLHHGIGVGKPLNNKRVGNFVTRRRARFGTEIVDQSNVRQVMEYYHRYHVPVAYMMLSDQSPSNPHRSHWCHFLNQDTAFLYGAEHFARKYNMPVLYYEVSRVRRGRYQVRFQELAPNPSELSEGDITDLYARRLEKAIRKNPPAWLWSHRRWKLTRQGRILKDGTLKIIKPE